MFQSYFKIGWRNLFRNKGYSLINIGGLALGMAVAMVIGLWLLDELSYNKNFANYDRVAKVMKAGTWRGKHYEGQRYLPYLLIEELKNNYGSQLKAVIPVAGNEAVMTIGENHVTKNGMWIGEEGPEAFSFEMLEGNWNGLADLHSILLSQSTAKALFGDQPAAGKTFHVDNGDVTVTGVYSDFPHNSELYDVQFFQPWAYRMSFSSWILKQDWANHSHFAYAFLQPNTTLEQAKAVIKDAEIKACKDLDYMREEISGSSPEVTLQPMSDWHLRSDFKEGELQTGPVQFVWFIGSIGAFVLLLACINFMNLSTARSERRAKEVGIRKTIGSVRRQLVGQFLTESLLTTILAAMAALTLVSISLPWFNVLSGKLMQIPFDSRWFWIALTSFILLTGILAGSYPALYLSAFKPSSILRGTFRAGRFSSLPRKVLVVVQFTVSVLLVICTGVIYRQLMFVKDRPVGYDREGLLMITKKTSAFDEHAQVLENELKKSGAVLQVAESGGPVTSSWSGNGGFTWPGKRQEQEGSFATLNVSLDFGRAIGWQFVDGRDFNRAISSDSNTIVINESAVKQMELKNPVGQMVHWNNRAWGVDRDLQIIGVVKDMVMESPFNPVRSTVFFTYGWKGIVLLRINPAIPMKDALQKVQKVFATIIPDVPFEFKFTDEEYARKFETEDRIGKLAAVFAVMAIVISCLGLLGLASFVAEQKTKEIGIRKVLGASIASLWGTLSSEFMILVGISCLIAMPVAWYILSGAIKRYEYKTTLGWPIFLLTGAGALLVTLLTVSFQALKAAYANPVNSLRSE